MKRKIVKAIVFIVAVTSASANATITNVLIVPSLPTPLEVIFIDISGAESSGGVTITDSVFLVDGTFLQLDLSLFVGILNVITPWSHTEDVGTLPEGLYDLTVRTLEYSVVTDTYSMSFEVVPEPATFVLFGLGLPVLRVFSRRKWQGFLQDVV